MATSLRDRFGRFGARPPQAAPAEAGAEVDVAAEEQAEDDFALPETPSSLYERLAEAREQRAGLLRDGNIDGVIGLDSEIARLTIAVEVANARAAAYDLEQEQLEQSRVRAARQALRPQLEAARRNRDHAAFLLFEALNKVVALEEQAEQLGISLDGRCPLGLPLTSFNFDPWIAAHLERQAA